MESYIKNLIQNNEKALAAEKEAFLHCGNLPVLHSHNTKLNELQETVVKTIYLSGGMYISDLKMMLAFSAEVQSIERAVKELNSDGYLVKSKNPFGVLLGLSKEGVSQIKMHPTYIPDGIEVNCQDMDIFGETAAMKHKCISYAVAEYVFNIRLNQLWNKFWTTEKFERNYYLAKQFLKQIVYRDFLAMDVDSRERFLLNANFTDEEKNLFLNSEKYIVWNASKFSELVFIHEGFEKVKNMTGYHEYMQIIKRDALCKPNYNSFYLLKDMIANDDKQGYKELQIIWNWKCTMLKFGADKFRVGINGTRELITKEKKIDSANRYLFVLQNERRSLINSNSYRKKSNESELGEALVKLAELDYGINEIRAEKVNLEVDFSFAILKSYEGSENDYEEKVLNLQRLSQNGVFVSAKSDKEICIYVVQTNEEYFDLFSLHKKLSMGLQLIKRIFPYAIVEVRIYTYNTDQKEFIERILPSLVKKLLESRETAFYASQFDDICSIHKAQDILRERYLFFQNIKKEMEGEFTYDEEK